MSFENISFRQLKETDQKIGDLSNLSTTDKTSVVAAMNELFTSASNGKSAIATAVTGKGIPTSATDTFAQMAQNISNIQTGNVPAGSTNSKCYKKTFESKITSSGWIYLNDADSDIATHREDPTFVVTIMNVTDFSALAGRTVVLTATNHKYNSYSSGENYGILAYISGTNGGQGYGAVNKAVTTTSPAAGGHQICVTADGKIGIYSSSTTSWEAGTYVAICGW